MCLETDWFWSVVRAGKVEPWLAEAHEQNGTVVDAAAAAMSRYAAGGYAVVAEGILGPWFLPVLAAPLRAAGVPLHYAVLRPPLEVCVDRVRSRAPAGGSITSAPARHMWEQFSDLGPYEAHVVDNEHLSPAEAAETVLGLVSEGHLLVHDPAS